MPVLAVAVAVAEAAEEKRIEEELSFPILLSDRVQKAVTESVSFKLECSGVGKQVDRLSHMLRAAVCLSTTTTASSRPIYHRPVRRISADVCRNLHRALNLVQKCRHRNFFLRIVNIVTPADFRKILFLLDSSIADMRWLLSVFSGNSDDGDGGIVLSLPPIASNDPILAWIWSYIASVQMSELSDRVEAANELASLAQDNDRNKKMIVEEGGVTPLLKLLKENSSIEAQIAAAIALYNVGNDEERVGTIIDHHGAPLIVQVLRDSSMKVQIKVANLVSRMAEHSLLAKEEFSRENVIGPLVSLLSFETFEDDHDQKKLQSQLHSIPSIVQISKEKEKKKPRLYNRSYSSLSSYSESTSIRVLQSRKERENESPEVKRELKTSCSKSLWMLSKDSLSNSRRITETKGLLCLSKLIEKEKGELQKNCLMAIMEITFVAESNADFRRSAFKTNSPAAKSVVDQLLTVVKESSDPTLQIPAIKSIGSLSRTFPARETRVVGPLVDQLSNNDHEVATEATIALGKFASPENFLCNEHSNTIIEFNGVLPLMRLLRASERGRVHGLILLCYLAIHGSDNEALEQSRVLTVFEGAADRTVSSQQPQLRELITKAIYHLDLYRGDIHPHRQPSRRRQNSL